jgi:hypothetical protein
MDVRYLILVLIFLAGCMPEPQLGRANMQSTDPNANTGTTKVPAGETSWHYLGALTRSITINASNLNTAYIVGQQIEQYLGQKSNGALVNFSNAEYCLVSDYLIAGSRRQFRARVIPVSYVDITSQRTVRILRADFHEVNFSSSTCQGSLEVHDGAGGFKLDSAPASLTYSPADICANCTSVVNSVNVRLFQKTGAGTFRETPEVLRITGLSLHADPNNNANNPGMSCTNSECKSRGFDCCLDNQCVMDGAVRPSAQSQYPDQLASAQLERVQNPLSYLNYPHLYYICGISQPPGTTTGGSSGGGVDAAFELLKKDQKCVEHIKGQAQSMPFHFDVLLDPTPFTPTTDCLTADQTQQMHFVNVFKRLYQTCGCSRTTIEAMVQYCPTYEYVVASRDTFSGEPTKIDCYTPPTAGPQPPLQQTVHMSSRTVPHRFFDENGTEQIPTPGSAHIQESAPFSYADDTNTMPNQAEYSMNAILGPITVNLSNALPAKMVPVQLDQVLFLHTTSGTYTPCPNCGSDSWLASFSAHPSSPWGVGLQSIGHTTERDFFSNNLTRGNFEDTIFGRACWVPPTMLPFSHMTNTFAPFQRRDRLQAQAALFNNGYQRDWYGFNKGALIGSFDGVTWFAIGKGRIVRASSNKLFLAINAPFGDLASPTIHSVNVQTYDGVTQAADVDYDPRYHLAHPLQNEAGTCQANHFCSTDTDCITRLGWEYACADVRDIRTQWPVFDSAANELASQVSTGVEFYNILQQKRFPSSDTKRCVYRGAGAPCIVNSSNIQDVNLRKAFTCAPNFHCANVSATGVFNSKIARFGVALEDIPTARNHLFGKDANVLGRPLHYIVPPSGVTESTTLPSRAIDAFRQNMSRNVPMQAATDTGLCRPGKALPETNAARFNPYEQHRLPDNGPNGGRRTDYINQIASCNSGLFTDIRYSSCPVIGADGNYEMFNENFLTTQLASNHLRARLQNSCGLDSLSTGTALTSDINTLSNASTFRTFEGRPLHLQTIMQPTLVRDACMRRAGQVCHTDLDCAPNKFHAARVDEVSLAFFGNIAEREYHREHLVCGQEQPKPSVFDTEGSRRFSMTANRCCREIGRDFTTFTADIPQVARPLSSLDYEAASRDLRMSIPPGIGPSQAGRYSRLATVANLGTPARPYLSAFQNRDASGDLLPSPDLVNVQTQNQWVTLNEANSSNCCGGGWIRKFADGSSDWGRSDRLQMDVSQFRCINSRTPLMSNWNDVADQYIRDPANPQDNGIADLQTLLNRDFQDYCKDVVGQDGSCAMYSIDDRLQVTAPTEVSALRYGRTVINTVSPNFAEPNYDFYFMPRSADGNADVWMDYRVDFSNNPRPRRNIQIRLPSYVSREAFDRLHLAAANSLNQYDKPVVRLINAEGDRSLPIQFVTGSPPPSCAYVPEANLLLEKHTDGHESTVTSDSEYAKRYSEVCTHANCTDACVYSYNPTTRILKVLAHPSRYRSSGDYFHNMRVGVEISFKTTGSPLTAALTGNQALDYKRVPNSTQEIRRTRPGSNIYYLKKFGRLELNGIPQIGFEPIMCNDVSSRLVGGIFKPQRYRFKSDIEADAYNGDIMRWNNGRWERDPAYNAIFVNRQALAHEPIFAANEFRCCTPLGKRTANAANCCSGYSGENPQPGQQVTCRLPPRTNLSVYFNRYVSNEGRDPEGPGGGLVDSDFDPITGEPRIDVNVIIKLRSLGNQYCLGGKVVQGGAFGSFAPEPDGPDTDASARIYGIVDSPHDFATNPNAGQPNPVGYQPFMEGFRWNHHLYCGEGQ